MDEPSLGPAPILVQQVFAVIKKIKARLHTTVLLLERNASMALAVSHRGPVMETRLAVLAGTAQVLLRNPQVRDAYLGGRRAG